MELTTEKQAINGTLLYAIFNNGYPKSYVTGILKTICVSNKQVFLEAVLKKKKLKIGKYIASGRNYLFLFFVVRFVYLFNT